LIFFFNTLTIEKITVKTSSLLGPNLDNLISILGNTAGDSCKQGYPYLIPGMLAAWRLSPSCFAIYFLAFELQYLGSARPDHLL